jgi:PleD family two-component response regulator
MGEGVTLSCGVAQMLPGETLEALIARADAALRRAKENGRDRVEAAS